MDRPKKTTKQKAGKGNPTNTRLPLTTARVFSLPGFAHGGPARRQSVTGPSFIKLSFILSILFITVQIDGYYQSIKPLISDQRR